MTVGDLVGAITMPARLGALVQAQLVITMLAGPVLSNPDGRYWTFLARSDSNFRGHLGELAARHGVRLEAAGTYIAVPTEGPELSARWITPPRPNHVLPPIYAVAATTRRVCTTVSAG
jgi:hypothetical protein